jgi:hypothetical protein
MWSGVERSDVEWKHRLASNGKQHWDLESWLRMGKQGAKGYIGKCLREA